MKSLTFTEIETIASNLNSLAINSDLKSCSVALTKHGRLWGISGGQCRVYKIITKNGQTKALRFWKDLMNEAETRCQAISNYIAQNPSPYFLNFEFIPNAFRYKGEVYPVILMDWCSASGLKSYVKKHLTDIGGLRLLQNNFLQLIQNMHQREISHGDLHHDNIRVYDDGKLMLIDYDSLYVPELNGMPDNCLGYAGYQLPLARESNSTLSSKTDYFSELIIYLSIEALIEKQSLWSELDMENQDQSFMIQPNEFGNFKQSVAYQKIKTLGGNVPILLKILCKYLRKNNLNELIPFYDFPELSGVLSIISNGISNYCIQCGSAFYSEEDLFCTKCGSKRI